MALALDYNSPLRSRQGLVGDYYNDYSGTHAFPADTVAPTLTRVDPNAKFDWSAGSPYTGVITTDNFLVRWKGYFIAPATATYQFGTTSDNGSKVYVSDMNNANVDAWSSSPTNQYGAGIALTAGQVIQIKYEYNEWTGNANAQLLVKTTDGTTVTPQSIPGQWLQTGARPIATPHGLIGHYYTDPGAAHTFPTNTEDSSRLFLTRTDTSINQNWGANSPVPGGPSDNFMVRWTGQFTPQTTDTYTFGVGSDDGARVYLKINGVQTLVADGWSDHSSNPIVYGSSGVSLTANTPIPITVEYYENTGSAQMGLYVREQTLNTTDIPVDSNWLTPQAQILPDGWGLGLDGDGTLRYSYASINSGGVTLYDSTGQTFEYKFTNGAFTPPVNESGHMVRNGDGTITLQDQDGQTYVFTPGGSVQSVTRPGDDRTPAALQYTYGSTNGSLPRLTQITDPVDTSRWLKVFYGGDTTNCPAVPSGFVAIPGHNFICGVSTSDGQSTGIFYSSTSNGIQLGRITLPGNEFTDYQYASGMLSTVRDNLANDVIAAGLRTQDTDEKTTISYDPLGRANNVSLPAATAGATRIAHTYDFQAPNSSATLMHVANATEPNGFTRKVAYDGTYRTTSDIDIANLATITAWDSTKDLVLSTTDPAGLKSTILYDYADRPTDQYGPAPTAWFDATTRKPLTTPTDYTPQVPHTQTGYDESINGLGAAYYEVNTASNVLGSTPPKVLFGNPKLHGTGVGPASGDVLKTWGGTPPITPTSGNGWGVSLTGWVHLATNGNYTFRVKSDDGVRLWVGDTLLTDDWTDNTFRSHPNNTAANGVFNNTKGDYWYRIHLDYYNKSVGTVLDTDAQLELYMTPPGGSETSALGSLLKPGYGLVTTQKTFDSSASVGDTVTTNNYGSNPELGLIQSSSVDPTGLNYTTNYTYEVQGASGSFLRQLSKTLPGGVSTGYTYYGATETRDNPCTTPVEAYKQAGMLKIKTDPDPDGAGTQTPITTESIYDDAGRVVATRVNSDSWTCTTYDTRGRVTQTSIPTNAQGTGRIILNNWAVGGNPLITGTGDSTTGTVDDELETTVDLLGRQVGYRDSLSYTFVTGLTTTSYDNIGRMISRSSPVKGLEEYTYDNYNRLINNKLAGTIYATSSYDSAGRLQQVTYPAASQLKLVIGRDNLGRAISNTYTLGNGTAGPVDTITRSQSGQVISGTELSQAKTYTYDKAGRLTAATLFGNTYGYSFANPTTCTGTYNANSGKDSNRTSQTVNGATTTYCYDYADRVTTSSDQSLTSDGYDTHGNTTQLGLTTNTSNLQFGYDSSDRTSLIRQNWGTPANIQYYRDTADRIYYRGTTGSTIGSSDTYFSYTGPDDSPDVLLNASAAVIEKYLSLPGGVEVTVRSGTTRIYSLVNTHSDTMGTVSQSGASLVTFKNDPFGEPIGTTFPGNVTGNDDFGYVGQHQKLAEPKLTNTTIEMGARIYIPVLGRFTTVDPVEGGSQNDYSYPPDPINDYDITGQFWSFGDASSWAGRNKWNILMTGTMFVPGLGEATLVFKATKVVRLIDDATRISPYSKYTGINSRLFGSSRTIKGGVQLRKGLLNRGPVRAGWSKYAKNGGNAQFRLAAGGRRIPFHSHYEIKSFNIRW